MFVLGDEAVNRLIDLSGDLGGGAGGAPARRSMPVQRGMLIAMRKSTQSPKRRCKSWWKKWLLAEAAPGRAERRSATRRLSDVVDEERDDDASGDRETGQDDADGDQQLFAEAGLEPSVAGVGFLEAELHGVEQAIEGALVLMLRDEGVNGLIDLSGDLGGCAGGSAGRRSMPVQRGMLIAMRIVYPKFERRRKSWSEPRRVGGRQLDRRPGLARG